MRYALIERTTNAVSNIVLWDGQADAGISSDWLIREIKDNEECRIGDVWDGSKYYDPIPPVPTNPMAVTLNSSIVAKPFEFNGIGWNTIAQGPLTPGSRVPIDGKPGIWLVGDKIPGIEGYSVTRVV